MIRVAACQYAIDLHESWDDYVRHLENLCAEAAEQGARLLVLPEYAGLVLSGLLPPVVRGDLHGSIAGLQAWLPKWLALCEAIARRWRLYFLPGSAPVLDGDGLYRNRAWLFGPDGLLGCQDKLLMTRFEREQWNIVGGRGLRVFDTAFGKLGILICYDNEFPLLARALAEQEVDLILAPSCTDTEAGYHRVRIGAQARALENQIAVLHAPTVGLAPWSPALDENVGRAGLYVPPDYGMPANGVLASSDDPMPASSRWLVHDLDLDEVRRVRREGQVFTRRDWPEQFTPGLLDILR
ncbi:carbon-nitrogen hydrolase family protein [Pseudomonas sp. ZM23]|uniref:Carbon-nitrogen hydrolase family protein n=1 Tax=Pseudomonas triclosanedens TaxID=2961893 RepID=A0ABY6ZV28_9PSED|nr:carbon-nitrogen hydrolase family protein [Pseudomonas triclosanedens]MCP8463141.1 carbon-nitrogen hydrolase family protein [Pseudomonas triclosanedens]MCP8469800.1 carbon-nitrogen hydrolase family protein [Pseudomonas triclosanedens]MCP8473942.1 carbon-nitrogen hydrolase family protein [Pseudomonas triclosanedens]WAI48659.1 carbon-nitrogen hydrolase family protein [Pseudomonas triclosanedens]